jgi:DNA-directed RNA polymerase specialized sigma24 family protein
MPEVTDELDSTATRAAVSNSFDTLFERLTDRGEAASAYSQLHFRLVTYFRVRFPAEAEALADETLDRLARRLKDGTQVNNVAAFALGIARLIVLEMNARQRRERDAARETLVQLELGPDEPDPVLPLLRRCLRGFDADSVQLIMDYYAADAGADRIEKRQAQARRLGMSLNALRNRALRIRLALEKCVRARLAQDGPTRC